jgi:ABC-type antimicrobial peptide transport system permease subunit
MPRVIGSRRRTRGTAGTPPLERQAASEPGRRALVVRGLAPPSPATLLAVVGIGLGASLVFVSLAVGAGVGRSIDRTVEVTLGRAAFRVSAPDGATLSSQTLDTILSVLGVEVGAPAVEQRTTLLPEADVAAPSELPVTILGIDPVLDGRIRDLDLVAGTTVTRPDEAAAIITERLAAEDGYGLGSDIIVATPGEPERFRVIGIAADVGPLAESDGRTVILPIEAVSRMFGLEGVARIDLLVEGGVPIAGVRAELGEALAGERYALTSPADLAESLRLATTGSAATAAGIAAVGVLVGALLVFGAVRPTRETGEVPLRDRVRDAAVRGAIGSGIGGVLALVLAAITRSDVAPAALGLDGIAAVAVAAILLAVAAATLPRRRVGTAAVRTVSVVAIALGFVAAVAMIGTNARHGVADQSSAAVLGRVLAQIDALGLLAVLVAGLAIVGTFALRDRATVLEAGILGFAGVVLGSIAGLAVGAALIVLGGRPVDPVADVPWPALGLCFALGIGLSTIAAWYSARLAGRPSSARAVQFGR